MTDGIITGDSIEAERRRVVERAVDEVARELHVCLSTTERVTLEVVLDRMGIEYPHVRSEWGSFW